MWWWRVAYLDGQGREVIQDANELHIPAGRPVVLELQSADVIHSFWVPRLSGKLDMIPGRRNLMRIQADQPGVFGGQCAEYCGGPHSLMGRSEEHTSELQSLMRISYAVFCLKKTNNTHKPQRK